MPKNTLFNYFGKSPSSVRVKSTTPKKSSSDVENSPPKGITPKEPVHKQGDLVWANVEGQSWLPGLIWYNSVTKKLSKHDGNSLEMFNIWFLNKNLWEQWISAGKIHKFSGPLQTKEGSRFHTTDCGTLKAVEIASRSLEELPSKRMQFVESLIRTYVEEEADLMEIDTNVKKEEKERPKLTTESRGIKSRRVRDDVPVKKYRRIIESDDSISGDDDSHEYVPDNVNTKNKNSRILSSDESEDYASSEDEPVETGKKRKRPSTPVIPAKRADTTQVKSKLVLFQASGTQPSSELQSAYLHETLDFLQPCNIKDANGKRPNDQGYDKTTLKLPPAFLTKQTPAMYQWWAIKAKNFDVILFFKVGKFYELYHMDAVVGVKELGLTYMKGAFAHSGFPEIAFGRYSAALVQKGYTVARVEQTETPEQNTQRIKGKSLAKYEKTLRREICRITTKGTQMLNIWNESSSHNHEDNFLLAVCERLVDKNNEELTACREIGVCFVDTSVGTFHIGQFLDDGYCSRFRTMISHHFPCQVLYERAKLSNELSKILHTGLASVLQCGLASGSQFWDAAKTLKTFSNERYFARNDGDEEKWPEVLMKMKADTDSLGLTAKSDYELAISALGACTYFLKKCLIDFEVISMRQFQLYVCEEQAQSPSRSTESEFPGINQRMILDSATLNNLELIRNSKGSSEESLLDKLDRCRTPFGRRLLRQWVCSPPCHPHIIDARLDAIDDLLANDDVVESLTSTLSKMPDLERMLAQIHSMSKGARKTDHPDSRAIMYEEKRYSKKKINDFMTILEQYDSLHKCLKKLQSRIGEFKSSLLQKILGLQSRDETSKGAFPDLEATLSQWKKAFDHKKARETGKIVPNVGTNPEYDQAMEDVNLIMERAESYLREQKKKFQCSKISYKGCGNKRFQLEIPLDSLSKRVPDEYEISGQRKGFKSFRTDATIGLVKEIEEAEARRDAAQADSMSIIFREFSKDYALWQMAVQYLAQVDVLISLTQFSKGSDGIMCRPQVLFPSQHPQPMLDIREGRHPCVTKTIYSDSFIPNDTLLGHCPEDIDNSDESTKLNCLLLTGPNMGGKSTLMRQVGLLVVLAQIGCYVPARTCQLTACDRIFTRLGAFDRIMAGESTFFVELGETSSILKHVTTNSLVLLDELGRGTSTYDGTAIASAVLRDIAENVGCRTIFSTHYRTLVDDAPLYSNVQLGHMACMVEDGDTVVEEVLTFLYKLASGACPKSYGFHAALLAGVSEDVVKLAQKKALELENKKKDLALFRNIFRGKCDQFFD